MHVHDGGCYLRTSLEKSGNCHGLDVLEADPETGILEKVVSGRVFSGEGE